MVQAQPWIGHTITQVKTLVMVADMLFQANLTRTIPHLQAQAAHLSVCEFDEVGETAC
jgi:hypothetical protein